MSGRLFFAVGVFLILMSITFLTHGEEKVRKSILAGTWYPGTKHGLSAEVERYLDHADPQPPEGRVYALISPHAGYRYSGQAAAYGYKLLEGRQDIQRVIILAPSHHWGFRGASVNDVDFYETPLGKVAVDKTVTKKLLSQKHISFIPYAHMKEHSLEIQLPFLQEVLGSFKLVPIIIGHLEKGDYAYLADAIKPFIDENTLLVVSSDFTHYGYNFSYLPFRDNVKRNLKKLDGDAVSKIIAKDFTGFRKYLAKTGITICGREPISILLKLLPPSAVGKQLVYYTSGDLTGDYTSTVSYVSIVFTVARQPVQQNSEDSSK